MHTGESRPAAPPRKVAQDWHSHACNQGASLDLVVRVARRHNQWARQRVDAPAEVERAAANVSQPASRHSRSAALQTKCSSSMI
eukprot:1018292-Pleurochrysis_carterae.AAC.1